MPNKGLRLVMLYGLPGFTCIFMLFMPACLQITFAFTSIFAVTQGRLFRYPPFRKWANMTPLPQKPKPTQNPGSPYEGILNKYQPPSPESTVKKGIVGGAISEIKGAASGVMQSAKETMESRKPTTRLTPTELRRAKAYEERRRKEIEQVKYEAEQGRERKRSRNV